MLLHQGLVSSYGEVSQGKANASMLGVRSNTTPITISINLNPGLVWTRTWLQLHL